MLLKVSVIPDHPRHENKHETRGTRIKGEARSGRQAVKFRGQRQEKSGEAVRRGKGMWEGPGRQQKKRKILV